MFYAVQAVTLVRFVVNYQWMYKHISNAGGASMGQLWNETEYRPVEAGFAKGTPKLHNLAEPSLSVFLKVAFAGVTESFQIITTLYSTWA